MNRSEFVEMAAMNGLTERRATAWYLRHAEGVGRKEAAEIMGTSASNVDNAEREAQQLIQDAYNLVALADPYTDGSASVGVCAVCDTPTDSMSVHPDDYDEPLGEGRMVCQDCAEQLEDVIQNE